MNPELKELLEKLQTIDKSIAEAVDVVTEEKLKTLREELKTQVDTISAQIKELAVGNKFATGTDDAELEKKAKEVFVKSTVEIFQAGIKEDKPAMEIFVANSKAAFQNEGTAGEGLEFVFDQFSKDVLMFFKNYPLVSEVSVITIKGVTLKIPSWVNSVTAAWYAEGASIAKSKGTSGLISFTVKKLGSLVGITEEMLEDNMTTEDLYNLIVKSVANSQAAVIENGIINSESTNMLGVLPNANAVTVSMATGSTALRNATAANIDNGLVDLDAAISDEYVGNLNNAVAVMSKYTLAQLKKAKTTTGDFMYPELRTASPLLLGKYRVITSTKMPVQGTGTDVASAKQLFIGNLKDFYLLVRSRQFTVTRGYATGDFEADLQSVKATQRLTGNVLAGQAFAILANSAT